MFQRCPSKSDLDRYLFYGKRIRTLRIGPYDLQRIDPGVFRAIAIFLDVSHPGCVVLPNWRELEAWCFDTRQETLWEIIPYLSPSIQKFHLHYSTGEQNLPALALVNALPSRSPFITQLHISGDPGSGENSILSTLACRFLHITSFESRNISINDDAIRHLASLPNLHDISLWFEDGVYSIPDMPAEPFSSLQKFTLNGWSIMDGVNFFRTWLRSVSLNSITLCAYGGLSPGEPRQLFSAFSSPSLCRSLTYLCVRHSDESESIDNPPLEHNEFEPLLQFMNLEVLYFETESSLECLSDDTLEAMSRAWPRLKALHFQSDFGAKPSQSTLNGFLFLVQRCPNLRSIILPFTASTKVSWKGRPGGGAVSLHMELLDVRRSPIADPGMVASFLSDIFPNLKTITAWSDYAEVIDEADFRYREQWKKAIELYGHFVKIRMEERVS
jgi:hypothetical protein